MLVNIGKFFSSKNFGDGFFIQILSSNASSALKKLDSFIDFENSFIQGDADVNTIEGIDTLCTDAEYKPSTSGSFIWNLNLNGNCVQPAADSEDGVYTFYWNAGKSEQISGNHGRS